MIELTIFLLSSFKLRKHGYKMCILPLPKPLTLRDLLNLTAHINYIDKNRVKFHLSMDLSVC